MSQNGHGLNQPLWLLLFFCAGVIGVRFLPLVAPPTVIMVGMAGAAMAGYRYRSVRWLCTMLIGVGWAAFIAAQLLERSIPKELEKQELVAIGRVQGLVREQGRGSRFDFRVESISHQQQALQSPGLIRLSTYEQHLRPQSGERWQFTVRLKHPHGLSNPGSGFDYETWLFHQRIRATGYVVSGQARQLHDGRNYRFIPNPWLDSVLGLRQQFSGFIGNTVSNPVAAGILSALSVGIRNDLGEDEWRILQDTGTIHLVAISGLHIGFVAVIAGLVAARLWRFSGRACALLPALSVAAVAGLVVGILYAMLAGFTLPTRRAVGMLLVAVLALLSRRKSKPLTLLAGVLAAILVIDPLAPLSSSFWLSFAAVAILLVIATRGRVHQAVNGRRKLVAVAGKWSVMQLWLLVGMMPILLAAFQKISLVAPAANLVAVPVIGMLVVPLVLLGFAGWIAGLPQVAELLLTISSRMIELVWIYLEWLASLPWAVWQQSLPPLWTLLAASVGIVLMLVGRALPGRWLGLAWLVPMLVVSPSRPDHGEFQLWVLDIGQGLGSVIKTRNHILVFDTGASWDGGLNMGKVVMTPALRHLDTRSVDKLVISHGDNDHIGGAAVVVDTFAVDSLLTSDPSQSLMQATRCEQGMAWHWDGVDFEILWPLADQGYRGNNSSCVLRVSSDAGSVLLTGDIEVSSERSLVRQFGSRLMSDVLVVPHHGSNSSSSPPLLGTVAPRIGLVSAGYLNRFGHPAERIRERYRVRGIALLNTAEEGAISIRFTADGLTANGQRHASPAFWKQGGKADFETLNLLLNAN